MANPGMIIYKRDRFFKPPEKVGLRHPPVKAVTHNIQSPQGQS